MNAREDDLLRPTLGPEHDVRSYRKLFNPRNVVWPSFFGGPLAAGILFGLNYDRMGRRDLALRCWIAGAALALVFAGALAWYILAMYGADTAARTTVRLPLKYAISGASLGIAYWLSQKQLPRYVAWESTGNSPANLWGPGILAVLAGIVVMLGGGVVIAAALGAFSR